MQRVRKREISCRTLALVVTWIFPEKKKAYWAHPYAIFFMEMNWYKYCKFLPAISQRFGKLKRKRERSQQHSSSRHIKVRSLKIRSMKTRREHTRGYIPNLSSLRKRCFPGRLPHRCWSKEHDDDIWKGNFEFLHWNIPRLFQLDKFTRPTLTILKLNCFERLGNRKKTSH